MILGLLELTMRTSTAALSTTQPNHVGNRLENFPTVPEAFNKGLEPPSVRLPQPGNGHGVQSLHMYTEEQVSAMLQVSLSQLRKWRMKQNKGKQLGPPFRKIGRLVRYPEQALQAYINGE
jgi:Helix-turn-helix domain